MISLYIVVGKDEDVVFSMLCLNNIEVIRLGNVVWGIERVLEKCRRSCISNERVYVGKYVR